jgi:surface antigen
MDKPRLLIAAILSLLLSLTAVFARPMQAKAETLGYPNATKPCVWAPYNVDGLCKKETQTRYEWGDRHDDNSPSNIYSSRGYAYRNCTDYVAWKLQSLGVADKWTRGLGHGGQWYDRAGSKEGLNRGDTPRAGAAAVRPISENDGFGHVAYVEEVFSDGRIRISEYNRGLDGTGGTRTGQPATMGFTKFVYFADKMTHPPAPPPNPDPDGDGFTGSNDLCPTVWGTYRGRPVKGDFSNDGKADVAAFYRYDGNSTNLWQWNGQGSRLTAAPFAQWSAQGFDASRLIPAGTGKFNSDPYQDTAAFYRHDNGMVDLDVWYGNAQGGLRPAIAWHVPHSWEGSRIIPAGAGDFNSDGRTDIAAFYRYDNHFVVLYVWYGQSGYTMSWPASVWSGTGWEAERIIPIGVGDMDGDRALDIATFYRHDGLMVDYNVWYGNGGGTFSLVRSWHTTNSWDGSRLVPGGVADINNDGRGDALAFYRHDGFTTDMRVWWGAASRVTGEPGGPLDQQRLGRHTHPPCRHR